MASKKRGKSPSVSEKLFNEGEKFSFFQATRLLQGVVRQWQTQGKQGPVGHDVFPENECIKYSVSSSLKFQPSEIYQITHAMDKPLVTQDSADMQVSFMGLDGPSSTLPVFFTEMEVLRARAKDTALKDFLQIFNHRLISLFYRAWEKYRLSYVYERHALQGREKDAITEVFEALLGIDGPHLAQSLPIDSEQLLYYAGLFASPRRSASGLQESLSEFLGVPVKVNQFKGEWLDLLEEDRSRLPMHPLKGKNNCLGVDMVIGEKFYTVEGKFELEVGPLACEHYEQFRPGSAKEEALIKFTELFVGANFVFDIKYLVESQHLEAWRIGGETSQDFLLGWNTWMHVDKKSNALQTVMVSGHSS